jgi:Tfp pilus assembly protein PilF
MNYGGRKMKHPQREILSLIVGLMVLAFLAGCNLQAKVWARVNGTVIADDGKPIEGVKVILVSADGEKMETTSDAKGNWRLLNVRPGPWSIGFLVKGFEPQNYNIELSAVKDNPPVKVTLARTPDSPFLAADALYKEQKYQEALQEYQKIIDAQPQVVEAYARIGLCYYRLDDLDKALDFFLKALEKTPVMPDVLINLGAIYLQKGDLENGVKYIKQLDEKSITDPSLFYNIGVLFFKEGHADLAIEYLQKCLALDANSLEAHYQLGLAHLNNGNKDEAKKSFLKVIELKPESEQAAFARKIVEEIK